MNRGNQHDPASPALTAAGHRSLEPRPSSRPRPGFRAGHYLIHALLWVLLVGGVAGCLPRRFERPMLVGRDSFAFANELKWAYTYNPATGQMEHRRRVPPPAYANRCVPMAKAARQFLFHAKFDPQSPPVSSREYERLVKAVLSRSPRQPSARPPILIPGYTNLYDFSAAHETLLKKAVGGAWQSYLHWGNLRMVFPFSRRGQATLASRWEHQLNLNYPPLVHVVTFPRLTLNHTLVLAKVASPEEIKQGMPDAEPSPEAVYFLAYDPNSPEHPLLLWFHRKERWFYYPRTDYFAGGRVNIYEMLRPIAP